MKGSAEHKPHPFKYKPKFGVIIICRDEREQQETYDRLKRAGYTLRVVTV